MKDLSPTRLIDFEKKLKKCFSAASNVGLNVARTRHLGHQAALGGFCCIGTEPLSAATISRLMCRCDADVMRADLG